MVDSRSGTRLIRHVLGVCLSKYISTGLGEVFRVLGAS